MINDMKAQYILEQPIEDLLNEIGDVDINQLYKDSDLIFKQLVEEYSDTPNQLFEAVIQYFEYITGKEYDNIKFSSTSSYLKDCIDDFDSDNCSNCLLDRFIRIILIACYEHK